MTVAQMNAYTNRYMSWIESVSDKVEQDLNAWKEVDFYDAVFTESEEEAGLKEKLSDSAVSGVQKIINAIKSIFAKIKDVISRSLAYFRADKDQKTKYKEFCEKAKNDPTFAGKKISYADYSKALGVYRACIDTAENDYRNLKDDEAANRNTLGDEVSKDARAAIDKATEKLEEGLKKAGQFSADATGQLSASLTVSALLAKCKNSQGECIEVMEKINKNSIMIQMIEKELGKKEIRKLKRKVRWLNLKAKFLAAIGKARHHQALTLSESIQAAIHGIDAVYKQRKGESVDYDAVGDAARVNKILSRTDTGKTAKKVARKAMLDGGEVALRTKYQVNQAERRAKHNRDTMAAADKADLRARENTRKAEERQAKREAKKAARKAAK